MFSCLLTRFSHSLKTDITKIRSLLWGLPRYIDSIFKRNQMQKSSLRISEFYRYNKKLFNLIRSFLDWMIDIWLVIIVIECIWYHWYITKKYITALSLPREQRTISSFRTTLNTASIIQFPSHAFMPSNVQHTAPVFPVFQSSNTPFRMFSVDSNFDNILKKYQHCNLQDILNNWFFGVYNEDFLIWDDQFMFLFFDFFTKPMELCSVFEMMFD